jgi:hypothetical protein
MREDGVRPSAKAYSGCRSSGCSSWSRDERLHGNQDELLVYNECEQDGGLALQEHRGCAALVPDTLLNFQVRLFDDFRPHGLQTTSV